MWVCWLTDGEAELGVGDGHERDENPDAEHDGRDHLPTTDQGPGRQRSIRSLGLFMTRYCSLYSLISTCNEALELGLIYCIHLEFYFLLLLPKIFRCCYLPL